MTTSNDGKIFRLIQTPSEEVPESWAKHATLVWGAPVNFPSCPVGWEVAGVCQLTPNMVLWGQHIKAETQEKDTQLIKDLHEVLARLRDTPCVKGYPGLDDLLLRSAARIEL